METNDGRKGHMEYIPQELLREIGKVANRLIIGIPCERHEGERRLVLTPEAIDMLTGHGHRVLVESGAGLGINYSDNHYSEAGAEIVSSAAEVFQADVIFKVLPPLPSEVAMMRQRTTLFSFIQLDLFPRESFEIMISKRITAISYEMLSDDDAHLPILNLTSEIEGAAAITVASELLSNSRGGKGILLGGIPGVSPTEVVVIGAGNAGTVATRAALALGASVKVFDDDINKLRRIQNTLSRGLFTSTFHPNVLLNAFRSADVVIGAMRYINSNHRYVIASELVSSMKRGALLIDLRISQGGCFETTCGLGNDDPEMFERYGVLHYCKRDISNRVARTTSIAYSNVLVPLIFSLGDLGSVQAMIKSDVGFRSGVYMFSGRCVNNYVSDHFNIPSNNLDIYLSVF